MLVILYVYKRFHELSKQIRKTKDILNTLFLLHNINHVNTYIKQVAHGPHTYVRSIHHNGAFPTITSLTKANIIFPLVLRSHKCCIPFFN